jgi:peptide/nickel transport system substrate-binding protein
VVAIVDESMTKLAALTSGELDLAGIQPAHADFVRSNPELEVVEYPLFFSYVLAFNTRRAPFDRIAFRRAVSQSIDREALVRGYLFGFGDAATSVLPPGFHGGEGAVAPFAPGRAKAAVQGKDLHFEITTVGTGEAAMEQMMQAELSQVGITASIRRIELASFLDRITAGDFEAAVMGISGDLELGYLRTLFETAGMAAPKDVTELVPAAASQFPAAFLYHAKGVQGKARRLRGVQMDLRGELPTLTEWSLQ